MAIPEYDPRLGDLTGPDFTGMTEDEIIQYWKNSTIEQRFHEVERLRRIKWGIKALWLNSLTDQSIIEKLKVFKENFSSTTDWWETLTDAQRESLDRGISDAENGRVHPHSEVMKKYGKDS